MTTNVVAIAAPDVLEGGYRSIMARYFVPCYIGIQLSVAYLFARKFNTLSPKNYEDKFWQLSLSLLIIGGMLSCAISSQQKVWWNKRTIAHDNLLTAQVLNQQNNSVILSSRFPFSLSHLVNPETQFIIKSDNNFLEVVNNCQMNYFLISTKKPTIAKNNRQKYQIKLRRKGRKQSLWQLKDSSCQNPQKP